MKSEHFWFYQKKQHALYKQSGSHWNGLLVHLKFVICTDFHLHSSTHSAMALANGLSSPCRNVYHLCESNRWLLSNDLLRPKTFFIAKYVEVSPPFWNSVAKLAKSTLEVRLALGVQTKWIEINNWSNGCCARTSNFLYWTSSLIHFDFIAFSSQKSNKIEWMDDWIGSVWFVSFL